jgi:hypothetical protein
MEVSWMSDAAMSGLGTIGRSASAAAMPTAGRECPVGRYLR